MGNFPCCPPAKLCDHTVDEVQGLLPSSDSKLSDKQDGSEVATSPVLMVKESKNELHINMEKDGLSTQLPSVPQSSYCSIIPILHTELSLSAQASQSASPVSEAPEHLEVEVASAALEDEGTQKEEEDFCQTPATEVNDVPSHLVEEQDKAIEKVEAQILVALTVQDASAKVLTEDSNLGEDIPKKTVEIVNEMDANKNALEEYVEKEEPKSSAEVSDEKGATQNLEPTLDLSTADQPEDDGHLAPAETAQNNADTLATENGVAESLVSSSQLEIVEQTPALAISEDKMNELREDASKIAEVGENLSSETEEPSEQMEQMEQMPSPLRQEFNPHKVENGQVDDTSELNDQKSSDVAEVQTETERSPSTCEDPPLIETEAELWPTFDTDVNSTAEEMEQPDSLDTSEAQRTSSECVESEGQAAGPLVNGLKPSAAVNKPDSTETLDVKAADTEPESNTTEPSSAVSLDSNQLEDESEPASQPSGNKIEAAATEKEEGSESHQAHQGEIVLSRSHATKISLIPVREKGNVAEKEQEQDDSEDLYRGGDEIEKELLKENQSKPLLEFTLFGVEKCSLAPAVDILAYSEREWKGNTAKSNLIRKGYSEISCSFTGLRRVRGDNYCSLRATLYQVLASTEHTPAWLLEEDFTLLPEKLDAPEHLIEMWGFPPECEKADEKKSAVEKLKHYMELLQKRWQEAAHSMSPEDKQVTCESIFQSGEEEYGLLEVLKLLMLAKAMELHEKMLEGQEVPVFCWLLFARDTSENPRMFFLNHLSQIGFSGGLEQVEMFLLGYALQHTIQVFRLYKSDTEEFVTHYPDDHKQDWPCVCVVTEDDRHYNVPVRKLAQYREL